MLLTGTAKRNARLVTKIKKDKPLRRKVHFTHWMQKYELLNDKNDFFQTNKITIYSWRTLGLIYILQACDFALRFLVSFLHTLACLVTVTRNFRIEPDKKMWYSKLIIGTIGQ